jgi:hypothetical protein
MTYVHATTWCQMSCKMCCHDYGAGKRGKHMDWNTFIGAVHFAEGYGECIDLGGGEITLHPKFRQMIMYVLDNTQLMLHFTTNGGKAVNGVSKNLRWYIDLQESGMYADHLDAELSLDQFHDPVEDGQVLAYFTRYRHTSYGLSHNKVRDIGDRKLAMAGRALKLDKDMYQWQGDENQCACEEIQIYPDGRITGCGCPDSPIIAQINHHGYDNIRDINDIRDSDSGCCSPSKLSAKAKKEELEEVSA